MVAKSLSKNTCEWTHVWLLKANTIGSDLPLSRIKWLKNILICWRSQRRSERLELRSWKTSTVLAQLGFPQTCQLMGQLWPMGCSQQSSARHNCTWYFRLQSRKFSCTQRHSGKWAVTKTASLGEMEIVGGWCPYTCMELFSPWIRRKIKWFPRESKLITLYKVCKLYKRQSSSLTDCKM